MKDFRIKVTPEGIERWRRVIRQCAAQKITPEVIEGLRRVTRAGISLKGGLKNVKREDLLRPVPSVRGKWISLREIKKRGV